jgi:hypothetical protein
VSFGRLLFGAILAGIGGVLLASQLGYLPAGVMPWFLQFWPALLILIGIAFLANAMKNLLLGWLAAILALAAIGFGAWWLAHNQAAAGDAHVSHVDLERPRVEALTFVTRTLGGKVVLRSAASGVGSGGSARDRTLHVTLRGVSEKDAAYRWQASGRSGLFEWPKNVLVPNTAPFGGSVMLSAPRRAAIRVRATSLLSGADLDLSDLRPESCELTLYSGAARVTIGDDAPQAITIRGAAGAAEILLPAEGPVRVEFHSPFTARSLPDDFLEHVGGKRTGRLWVSEGRGKPLEIVVDGVLLYVKIKREPQKAG